MSRILRVALLMVFSTGSGITSVAAETTWQAGFSKVDVTPTEPVRMSGYGSRDRPSEGVETQLFVRAVCLKHASEKAGNVSLVLLTIDNVGLSGAMTKDLAAKDRSETWNRTICNCLFQHAYP